MYFVTLCQLEITLPVISSLLSSCPNSAPNRWKFSKESSNWISSFEGALANCLFVMLRPARFGPLVVVDWRDFLLFLVGCSCRDRSLRPLTPPPSFAHLDPTHNLSDSSSTPVEVTSAVTFATETIVRFVFWVWSTCNFEGIWRLKTGLCMAGFMALRPNKITKSNINFILYVYRF